ncbi:MAG: hypothetical protein HY810_09190 [Candidatus Omnitrophica bacterium]|nr:hypothetical protein [Candidatus Omnitrophota bacterium]
MMKNPQGSGKLFADLKPKKINKNNFKKYGWIIEWDGQEKAKSVNQFRIVIRDRKVIGWRIAYLIVREKIIDKLEQHPFSMESFEPVKGEAVLFICSGKTPEKIEAFKLDQPVILKRGIWHGIICIGKEAHVKITENNRVKLVFRKLGFKLSLQPERARGFSLIGSANY